MTRSSDWLSHEKSSTKQRIALLVQRYFALYDCAVTDRESNYNTQPNSRTMALNPHQKNKVDINSLSEEEQKLFRLYGKLPNKKDLFSKKLQERKYFDSGDYALSKAGKSDAGSLGGGLGREHPTPENIPHLSQVQSANGGTPTGNEPRGSISGAPELHPTGTSASRTSGSPVKESNLQRGLSVDEQDPEEIQNVAGAADEEKGMPIRQ